MIRKKKKKSAGFVIRTVLFACFAIASTFIVLGQSIRLHKDNGVVVNVNDQSNPDAIYKVLCSENLVDWRLAKIKLGTGEPIDWTDPETNGVNQRFYKIEQMGQSEASAMDFDNDGFDDVYELNHADSGMDPMVANHAFAVSSVSVAETAIAAGALQSALHQTTITIQLSPKEARPVLVWLRGGVGVDDPSRQIDGFATVTSPSQFDSQIPEAGVENRSQAPIKVMTDAAGSAVLTLTSSNKIDETCEVYAQVGTIRSDDVSQAKSEAVRFEQGVLQVNLPGQLMGGQKSKAIIKRTDNAGRPLVDHPIVIFVRRVLISGIEYHFDPANPSNLSDYVTVLGDGLVQKETDENGEVAFDLLIADTEGLTFIEIEAQDSQVFFGE